MGKKPKARNGQGWKSRRSDGRYDCGLPIWSPSEAGTKYLRTTAKDEPAADKWLTEKRYERDRGLLLDFDADKLTVEAYLLRWLEYSVKHSVGPLTYQNHEWAVRTHIVPALGRVNLGKLTPAHVQGLYAEKLTAGMSAGTVRNIHKTFRKALGQAKRWRLVHHNVCDDTDPPHYPAPEWDHWTLREARTFLEACEGDRLEALWHLALRTGMREGELLALRWSDADLQAGTLQVRRAVTVRGAVRFTATKSGRGRPVKIGPALVDRLGAHRKRQLLERMRRPASLWEEQDLVFPGPRGDVLRRQSLVQRYERLIREASVKRIKIHELRHTAASLMMEAGLPPKVVSETLGHSSVKLTLDTYSHVSPAMQDRAAETMEKLLS